MYTKYRKNNITIAYSNYKDHYIFLEQLSRFSPLAKCTKYNIKKRLIQNPSTVKLCNICVQNLSFHEQVTSISQILECEIHSSSNLKILHT